ncbi:hypothetical protein G6F43_011020 [Rhizopus delemar]|nr:hypothetical protein G6F43_011020 [Rhizopus delemar]
MFPHRPLLVGIDLILSISVYAFLSQKIELLDQNATGQLNQTELGEWAMNKFNLDQPLTQQTISNIVKNAETLYSNINVVNNGKSLKATRYPQLDEVVKLIADMNNNNLPVNRDSILRYLNVAFGRQNRKIALLLDNASVHKIRISLNNIKLIFLLANTASKLQALDAGIIDNFKAHFRAQQYDRDLWLYISKKLDNPNVYKMDQAQAMFFLANEWLKVKPETINGMLPDLPRNFDNKVTDVSQLNLEADESEMIVCYTTSTTNNEETAKGNINETEENDKLEQDEQRADIVECKKRLRKAYETILMYETPLDDLDRKLHRRIRMRLTDSCAELNKSKEQTV